MGVDIDADIEADEEVDRSARKGSMGCEGRSAFD